MSRPAALEPRWLIGLLNQWALRSAHEEDRGLGFPAISVMLQGGIPGRTTSYDPTGYGEADFRDIDAAVQALSVPMRLSVLRYFKPWARNAIDAEMPKWDADRWMYHLHQALVILSGELSRRGVSEAALVAALCCFSRFSGYSVEIV